jgi:outer membrane immunogenic protein
MKKLLLAGVALGGFAAAAGAASAADLPARNAPPPAVYAPAIPVFTWTGFYAGVNAGYGFSTNNSNDTVFVPGVGLVSNGGNDGGFVGGGQIGYNYQFGSFVVGLETDLQFADMGDRIALDYFGTVRGRAGVAFDRLLVFGTGGFAYGGGNNNNGCFVGATFVTDCGGNDTATGWTAGGGVEYAFTNNLTAKVEALYVNLDRSNNTLVDPTTGVTLPGSNTSEFGVVRAGVNYKF